VLPGRNRRDEKKVRGPEIYQYLWTLQEKETIQFLEKGEKQKGGLQSFSVMENTTRMLGGGCDKHFGKKRGEGNIEKTLRLSIPRHEDWISERKI